MKRHEEWKFICDFKLEDGEKCNKKFFVRHLLNDHINNSHRGIKKYNCSQCGMGFRTNVDMKYHVLNIHQMKKIKCELCQTLIGSKDYYKKHILNSHKDIDRSIQQKILEKIRNTKIEALFTHSKIINN
jgi:hypothetical protein